MPTTECSHCESHIDAIPLNMTDTMFDWQCPRCDEPVVIDGSATEQQRRSQAREHISNQIIDLGNELDTPNYRPSPYSVEKLEERLESILEEIESEIDRRNSG